MHPQYLFFVNPFSGAGKGELIARLLNKLLPEHPAFCDSKGEVFLLANQVDQGMLRDALSGAEAVVAVGGDGTASYLIPHILDCGSSPALGLIPLGTSNDLARVLGVSVDDDYADERTLRRTLDRLPCAERESLDVFSVNKRQIFCNYFSVGLDAAIVRDFDNVRGSGWAKLLPPGRWTNNVLYLLAGLRNAGYHMEPPVEVHYGDEADGNRLEIDSRCRAVIVTNLPVYAGGCPIRPDARKDDGLFEITIVYTVYQFIRLILSRFLPFFGLPHGLGQYRARRARIDFRFPAPCQIDGEQCSDADAFAPGLAIAFHASLRVLAPRASV